MPRTENQKIKMLYVLEYLWKHTDENNGVSVGFIIDYLDDKGITADRRSIYLGFAVSERKRLSYHRQK